MKAAAVEKRHRPEAVEAAEAAEAAQAAEARMLASAAQRQELLHMERNASGFSLRARIEVTRRMTASSASTLQKRPGLLSLSRDLFARRSRMTQRRRGCSGTTRRRRPRGQLQTRRSNRRTRRPTVTSLALSLLSCLPSG